MQSPVSQPPARKILGQNWDGPVSSSTGSGTSRSDCLPRYRVLHCILQQAIQVLLLLLLLLPLLLDLLVVETHRRSTVGLDIRMAFLLQAGPTYLIASRVVSAGVLVFCQTLTNTDVAHYAKVCKPVIHGTVMFPASCN